MQPIKLGLIGCGLIGRTHADCIVNIPEANFTAYADTSQEAAQACLDKYGGEYATTNPKRLLDDESISAIYICTRHDSHAPLTIAAARAGKHVLVEKPLALSVQDCEEVARVVQETGVLMMPAFKMRYYPLIKKAREFIPEPQVLVMQMMDASWPDDKWVQDPIQGGGNINSQGCHTTDLLRYLAGSEPVRLWASGGTLTHPGYPGPDQCVASIQLKNGHVASWIQGDAGLPGHTGKMFFQLFGNGRNVQLYDRLKTATFSDGSTTWTETRDDEEGFQLENRDFIDALLGKSTPAITAHDGIQATRLVLAAQEAIRTGQVQNL